ncbi:hypothetical protein [Cohnella cholangitidis]|uniref:Uncharacterized protein n=1 Tax=Cohnella cholangitidis TaxID=2598458 RepID=A0A7G5C0T8_9BACL|nr:hypothetical protein [Cohnella cholangitidis]QMV42822.1 hypothetical protein FPL14_17730 [Cohnella cholangitidis]
MPQRKSVWLASFFVLLLVCMTALPSALASAATAVELTVPIKLSFDKTVAAADGSTASKLTSLYGDLGALLKQDIDLEAKIKALHFKNEESLTVLRKQIRDINSDKIYKLGVQVRQTKDRYQPLFDAYAALNKQITLAKRLKNKTLNALLRAQADAMKLSVQYAREDIKAKEAALKSMKTATSEKIKAARTSLAAIDPLTVQIKAQRSAAGLPRSSRSPVWTNFKYAIKKNEAKGTLDSLSLLVNLSRQIVTQQQKIEALELRISDIIVQTRTQFL